MEKRQERTIAAFESVLIYLEQHSISPEPPLLVAMKKSLRASLSRIRTLGTTQHTAMMLPGGKVEHRRRELRRRHLIPLVRTLKPLLRFAPGEAKLFTVPHARADALTVAKAAIGIAKFLKPHRKLLASADYPPTFLADLQHEAQELALAAKRTAEARQVRARATNDLAREFAKGMKAVDVIGGIVMRHHGNDKIEIDFWKNRRRVKARIGRPPQRKSRGVIATDAPPAAEVALPA